MSIDFRAKFQTVGSEARSAARDAYRILAPEVERILRLAYGSAGVRDEQVLRPILAVQDEHYRLLLQADFSDRYVALVTDLQGRHAALGISMENYFLAFTFILNEMSKVLIATHRKKPDLLTAQLTAITQVIFIEMDFTLARHIAGIEEKAASARAALAKEMESGVQSVVGELGRSSGVLQGAAKALGDSAGQTRQRSQAVAAASETASASVSSVAAAAEELSASIGEIARQVEESAAMSQRGAEQAASVNKTVDELNTAAIRIGEVVSLINDIAGQTNLLALNATIEAARAGDAGKGFAVVANEVKNLANQTARATGEITGQVQAIQHATTETVRMMRSIDSIITDINGTASAITMAVEQQSGATQEISRSVQQASDATMLVTQAIDDVTRLADKTAASGDELVGVSGNVSRQASQLDAAVSAFLRQIRG